MNRRSKKSALRAALDLLSLLLFLALLGLVGAVEQGAELRRMLWAIPLLAALSLCAGLMNRT